MYFRQIPGREAPPISSPHVVRQLPFTLSSLFYDLPLWVSFLWERAHVELFWPEPLAVSVNLSESLISSSCPLIIRNRWGKKHCIVHFQIPA